MRHNTPHPKELRARCKVLRKSDVDGHVIAHDPHEEKVGVNELCCIN